MGHLKCLACKTRLHSTESRADPIGDLCPVCGSLLEPVDDLGEIVGYRTIETCGSTSHRGASVAGQQRVYEHGRPVGARLDTHERRRPRQITTSSLPAGYVQRPAPTPPMLRVIQAVR